MKKDRLKIIITFLFILSAFTSMSFQRHGLKKKNKKPNVILILADDQGYGDIACNGNTHIKTPNMDALKKAGVSLAEYHTATTCSPSRAGIMTGQYCNKLGVWHTINGREILKSHVLTIADVFDSAGYATGIFGKWHLGNDYPHLPQDVGFQEVLINKDGGVGQEADYWGNNYFNDTYFHNGKPQKFQGYCTNIWFDNAMKFIERCKDRNKPFFCYLPLNAAHGPFHVPQKYMDMYKNDTNVVNPNFYGMITNIDDNLGRLRKQLQKWGIADNTILIYTSDNGTVLSNVKFGKGGYEEGFITKGFNAGMRGVKAEAYEGGHREPFFIYWKNGHITGDKTINTLSSYIDVMPTLLDLCNIPLPKNNQVEGKSLKPLLTGRDPDYLSNRILFVDNQREEFLVKWKEVCVMQGDWRYLIINGKDALYNVEKDPGERNNILTLHPKIAERLRIAYEHWWDTTTSVSARTYNYIYIGGRQTQNVTLYSTDCHMAEGLPAFNQELVRKGQMAQGFWAIHVMDSGTYSFELRRYPLESHLTLNAGAPIGRPVPGGAPYPKGKVMNIKKAFIQIDGIKEEEKVNWNAPYAKFTVTLPAGRCKLRARFIDDNNKAFDAYYVYVHKEN